MRYALNSSNLTVGEVARRSGLTVRTLHHYDAIGLVKPKGRSEAGYRLYNAQDIERLHAVLSLKKLGLSLEAIGAALAGRGLNPLELINQQIIEAERAIEQAQTLRDSLSLLQDALGNNTSTQDNTEVLLEGVRLLEIYQQFLPGHGIRALLIRWRRARPLWEPLATVLDHHRFYETPVDKPEVQRLVQQWMNIAMAVFGGQLNTVLTWAHMHRSAPETAKHAGLNPELLIYLEQAISARMSALKRHLSAQELERLDGSLGPEWEKFADDGQALIEAGIPPRSSKAAALRLHYLDLLARTVRHDAALAEKMRQAYIAEPILAHGHFVSPELRTYLNQISTLP
ncbi:MerR family transcriptional regulator [Alcaligenes faecalis]|uniref:MerR family transcriptional regulator n=1 Tax=Alcaligenes faecalis TaxID=511 RepID=UPI0031EA61F3